MVLFTYIYHKDQLNVGKYTIHGSYRLYRGETIQLSTSRTFFWLVAVVSSCRDFLRQKSDVAWARWVANIEAKQLRPYFWRIVFGWEEL